MSEGVNPVGINSSMFTHRWWVRTACCFFISSAIAVNSLTGPAMLCLPDTYQRSGLIPTTFTILFICLLSALCCLHMSNTISKVENNNKFQLDVSHETWIKN